MLVPWIASTASAYMRIERIETLAGLLPPQNAYIKRLGRGPSHYGVSDSVQAYSQAMSDPMFGWQFVKTFLDSEKNIPIAVTESTLLRAYCFHRYNNGDRDLRMAFQLKTRAEKNRMIMLQCMLLLEKLSLEHIAGELSLSLDTVRIYADLFWNVRDRLRDNVYINSLIYPDSTQVLWVKDYHQNEDPLHISLRAAYHYGMDTVKSFLGIANQTSEYEPENHAKTLEAQVLSTASHSARLGLLHQKDVASIDSGRLMVQSSKLGGDLGKDDDSRLGLGSFGMKASVLEHYRRISEHDIQYRLRLQQLGMDKELEATANRSN